MEMVAPFAKVFAWDPTSIATVAVLIGISFGFLLERAGFGNSKVLAGVWYGYNFAVIRVMYTAVVVAAIGLFGLYYMGVVNLDLVFVNKTYLWPQIVGGFIFGVGFNVGQYCPGTSAVAVATGKIDGMVFVGGFLVGVVGFAFAFPHIESFFNSSQMGRMLLSDLFGISHGLVVMLVVVLALVSLYVTHVLDRKLGNNA